MAIASCPRCQRERDQPLQRPSTSTDPVQSIPTYFFVQLTKAYLQTNSNPTRSKQINANSTRTNASAHTIHAHVSIYGPSCMCTGTKFFKNQQQRMQVHIPVQYMHMCRNLLYGPCMSCVLVPTSSKHRFNTVTFAGSGSG